MSVLVPDQRLGAKRFRVERLVPIRDVRHLLYLAGGEAKYGEPFLIAEEIKVGLRRGYADAVAATHGENLARFLSRSEEFWSEYEEVNRIWLPEDPVYSGSRQGAALGTVANVDYMTLSCGASGQDRVLESYIGGEMTASTVTRTALIRSTGGATPTNQTPEKFNSRSPAAASTFATAWTTSPTLSGTAPIIHAFNSFGGTDRWVPQPGEEIYLVNAEILSWKQTTTTAATVSSHGVWEEL